MSTEYKQVDDKPLDEVKKSQEDEKPLNKQLSNGTYLEEDKVTNFETQMESQTGSNIESIRKMIGFDYNPSATPPESYLKNRFDVAAKRRDEQPKRVQRPITVSAKRRSARIANVEVDPSTPVTPSSRTQDDLCQEIERANLEIASLVRQIIDVCGSAAPLSNGQMCLFRPRNSRPNFPAERDDDDEELLFGCP
ncbi:hypothetical protein RI129_011777 [Pyrocoelia pectoralis]|uniref:Uncharacterized protein n=1 Tax=Pyrocoelia pectoralis TaxID=417401 RepID=A0AAN7UXA6_9COLE